MAAPSEYEWYELDMDWSISAGSRLMHAIVWSHGKISSLSRTHWPNGDIAGVCFIIGIPPSLKEVFLDTARLSKYARFMKAAEVQVNSDSERMAP